MTLYKKDGTIYKLQSPNPAMNNQTLWDGFKTHNMQWDVEKDEAKQENKFVPPKLLEKETFLSALAETKVEELPQKEETFRKEVVHEDLQRKEEIKESNEIQKIFVHCLPATIIEKKDDLYGDSYKSIQYQTPTSFEGVLLNQTDLGIEIWTDAEITKGSIIYPKLGTKRWWKIQSKSQKAGGWALVGVPSTYQPSFDL